MKELRKVGKPRLARPKLQADLEYSGLSMPMTVIQYGAGLKAEVSHYAPERADSTTKDESPEALRSPLFSAGKMGRY